MLPSLKNMEPILTKTNFVVFDNKRWHILARLGEKSSRDDNTSHYHPDNYIDILFQKHLTITQIIALPLYTPIQEAYNCTYTVIYIGTVD